MTIHQEIIAALAEEFSCTPSQVMAHLEKHYGNDGLTYYLRRHHLPDYAALIEEGDRA